MKKRFPFSPFPSGWFCVAFSDELKPGEIQPRKLFGRDVILFRRPTGEPALLDAYCPHMGAHLGFGGTLAGDGVKCPMHGFCFDSDGACVAVPYGTKAPPSARMRTWPAVEMHGVILAFHDERGREPAWSVPALDVDGWSPLRRVCWTLRSHPQETSENSVDLGHFGEVHGYSQPTLREGPIVDGPHLTMRYTFKRRAGSLRWLARELDVEFEARVHGLGYSLVCARVAALGVETRHFVFATPTDGESIELRIALSMGPLERGPSVARRAWPLASSVLSRFAFREFAADVRQDFHIWENKAYLDRPVLAKGDGPIPAYRRWCRQFYPDDAPSLAIVSDAR